jgi:hypothetical protein
VSSQGKNDQEFNGWQSDEDEEDAIGFVTQSNHYE